MRLIQYRRDGARRVGSMTDEGRVLELVADSALDAIRKTLAGDTVLPAGPTLDFDDLVLLPPLDVPDNPWAFQLWGAGVTHKRSADAREEESVAATGAEANIYDRMYQTGIDGGKPDTPPGSKPEIFFKANGHQVCAPGEPFEKCATARRLAPEPELVAWFVSHEGRPHLVGYSGGNDFSDQGWESDNALYLGHAKVQDRFCSVGPILVAPELIDVDEVCLTCRVFRDDQVVQDPGPLKTGGRHMAHSIANLIWHCFDHRAIRDDEVRALFMGTSAVFAEAVEPGDRIEIAYDSGLGTLVNGVVDAD